MAGPGSAPKERKNGHGSSAKSSEIDVRPLTGAPAWPLPEDALLKARQMAAMDTLADVNGKIEDETDGRKLGGLRRQQKSAKEQVTLLDLQLSLAATSEQEIWRDLWALPQAEAWRAQGWTRDVAQYARHKAKGEAGSLDDAKEARQWSDRLGLSPRAAAQLGLKFKPSTPTPSAAPSKSNDDKVTSITSRRGRLTG